MDMLSRAIWGMHIMMGMPARRDGHLISTVPNFDCGDSVIERPSAQLQDAMLDGLKEHGFGHGQRDETGQV